MNTETLKIDGYTVTIANDESAENPFTAWDCEPPLLVYSCDRSGRLDTYNKAPETLAEFVALIPDAVFERGNRTAFLRGLMPGDYGWKAFLREFREYRAETYDGSFRDAVSAFVTDRYGRKPEGWRDAREWFDVAEWLLKEAGIPYHSTESNGYCQGDTVKLLAIGLPEWCKLVGCEPNHTEPQCKAACELYGAWAWGDVYGILSIHAPGGEDEDGEEIEGEELADGSVWGFYGRDHETSGLLESARETIASHKAAHIHIQNLARRMCLA